MALSHTISGTGSPPIVFVHGFGCGRTDWAAQVEHFSPRHQTIAVDLPGHGDTPPAVGGGSIQEAGAEVASLLRTKSMLSAVLVGHSMGCRVVLEAALQAPENVSGIVLLDGSRFPPRSVSAVEARFASGEYASMVRGMFKQMFTASSDPKIIDSIEVRALGMSQVVGKAMLLSMVRYDEGNLEQSLEALHKPLLVLQTTFVNDKRERVPMTAGQTTPYLDFIRSKVPSARIEVLPGVGHFPQIEAPVETNRILASFIDSLA
jgi:pimeloyl-ACP methyl ester carboxylesterase